MKTVFIGGSRRLGRTNPEIEQCLSRIVDNNHRVVIGDANGFDRAAQAYFACREYRNVIVYCTAGECRNNVGGWPVRAVDYAGAGRDREFYTAKDDAMLRDADCGFFAWDGESKGTLRNVRKLAERGRPASVYLSTNRKFVMVRSKTDARRLSRGEDVATDSQADLFFDSPGETVERVHCEPIHEDRDSSMEGTSVIPAQGTLFDLGPDCRDGGTVRSKTRGRTSGIQRAAKRKRRAG